MPRRNLCSCGCGQTVAPSTEIQHLQGKGGQNLSVQVLAENKWLAGDSSQQTHNRKRRRSSELASESEQPPQRVEPAYTATAADAGDGVQVGKGKRVKLLVREPDEQEVQSLGAYIIVYSSTLV